MAIKMQYFTGFPWGFYNMFIKPQKNLQTPLDAFMFLITYKIAFHISVRC